MAVHKLNSHETWYKKSLNLEELSPDSNSAKAKTPCTTFWKNPVFFPPIYLSVYNFLSKSEQSAFEFSIVLRTFTGHLEFWKVNIRFEFSDRINRIVLISV